MERDGDDDDDLAAQPAAHARPLLPRSAAVPMHIASDSDEDPDDDDDYDDSAQRTPANDATPAATSLADAFARVRRVPAASPPPIYGASPGVGSYVNAPDSWRGVPPPMLASSFDARYRPSLIPTQHSHASSPASTYGAVADRTPSELAYDDDNNNDDDVDAYDDGENRGEADQDQRAAPYHPQPAASHPYPQTRSAHSTDPASRPPQQAAHARKPPTMPRTPTTPTPPHHRQRTQDPDERTALVHSATDQRARARDQREKASQPDPQDPASRTSRQRTAREKLQKLRAQWRGMTRAPRELWIIFFLKFLSSCKYLHARRSALLSTLSANPPDLTHSRQY